MAFLCGSCGSFWPERCPCTKITDHDNKSNSRDAAGSTYELACRQRLAHGLPPNAIACEYHEPMLQDLARDLQYPGMSVKPSIASSNKVFEESVTAQSALLPMCNDCGIKQGVVAGTTGTPSVVRAVDTCNCASTILSVADCSFCEVNRIDTSKELATTKRAIPGASALTCECGNPIFPPQLIRKCVGCGGIKTTPYANFAGYPLIFEPGTVSLIGEHRPPPTLTAPQALAAIQIRTQPSTSIDPSQESKGERQKRKRHSGGQNVERAPKKQKGHVGDICGTAEHASYGAVFSQQPSSGVFQQQQLDTAPNGVPQVDGSLRDVEKRLLQQVGAYLNRGHTALMNFGAEKETRPDPGRTIARQPSAPSADTLFHHRSTEAARLPRLTGYPAETVHRRNCERRAARRDPAGRNSNIRLMHENVITVLKLCGIQDFAIAAVVQHMAATVDDVPKCASVAVAMRACGLL